MLNERIQNGNSCCSTDASISNSSQSSLSSTSSHDQKDGNDLYSIERSRNLVPPSALVDDHEFSTDNHSFRGAMPLSPTDHMFHFEERAPAVPIYPENRKLMRSPLPSPVQSRRKILQVVAYPKLSRLGDSDSESTNSEEGRIQREEASMNRLVNMAKQQQNFACAWFAASTGNSSILPALGPRRSSRRNRRTVSIRSNISVTVDEFVDRGKKTGPVDVDSCEDWVQDEKQVCDDDDGDGTVSSTSSTSTTSSSMSSKMRGFLKRILPATDASPVDASAMSIGSLSNASSICNNVDIGTATLSSVNSITNGNNTNCLEKNDTWPTDNMSDGDSSTLSGKLVCSSKPRRLFVLVVIVLLLFIVVVCLLIVVLNKRKPLNIGGNMGSNNNVEDAIIGGNGDPDSFISNSPTQVELPTTRPQNENTLVPIISLTSIPSMVPTNYPSRTNYPSTSPSTFPSYSSSRSPTISYTPSLLPTSFPSVVPSMFPTSSPTMMPSTSPTYFPTLLPSKSPTYSPTNAPSVSPTITPTLSPTIAASVQPTLEPSLVPSLEPSAVPTTIPSTEPSILPSLSPTAKPTFVPSSSPSVSHSPTDAPSLSPSTEFATFEFEKVGMSLSGNAAEQFGSAVSLSADGNIVAVGARSFDYNGVDRAGRVQAYRDAGNGEWVEMGQPLYGRNEIDQFGYAIDLSASGKRMAIGEPQYDSKNGGRSGNVRLYDFINGLWVQVGQDIHGDEANNFFGLSVALSADGKRLAAGAPYYTSLSGGRSSGRVRMFEHSNESNTWEAMGDPIDGKGAFDWLGWDVDMSADGSMVSIGAPRNSRGGFVQIYEWKVGKWAQVGKDITNNIGNVRNDDLFGFSVSLSFSGSRVAIGAPSKDSETNVRNTGSVAVYELENKNNEELNIEWNLLGDIDDQFVGSNDNDQLGYSVKLSSTGEFLCIGVPYFDHDLINSAGKVTFYRYNNELENWETPNSLENGLTLTRESTFGQLGFAVALSVPEDSNSTRLAVGSPGGGFVHVFQQSNM